MAASSDTSGFRLGATVWPGAAPSTVACCWTSNVHVPAGAVPKDGPSAGVALFIAIASLLMGQAVRSDCAVTGEISLRGVVLPVGGVKEKVLAALRAGIGTVLLPARNAADLEDIPADARSQLRFVLLETVDDVLRELIETRAVKRS